MKFCSMCGKEILDEAVVCPNCGCAVAKPNAAVEDNVSVGLCILSVLIPLFGIIYWALKYKETPKKAKACGIAAIISWVLSFIFSAVLGSVYAAIISSLLY